MAIDFVQMEIFHYALRRELVALTADFDHDRWRTFSWQLNFHHTSEDRLLWPDIRQKVTDPDGLELLDAMEAEHAVLDPLVTAIDDAWAAGDSVAGPLEEFAKALNHHLDHEEEAALPLVETVYTQDDWNAYTTAVREQNGDMRQDPVSFLPWLLKDVPVELRARMIAVLPPPARVMIRPT